MHMAASLSIGRDCSVLKNLAPHGVPCSHFDGERAPLCEQHRVGHTPCALVNGTACRREGQPTVPLGPPCVASHLEARSEWNSEAFLARMADAEAVLVLNDVRMRSEIQSCELLWHVHTP